MVPRPETTLTTRASVSVRVCPSLLLVSRVNCSRTGSCEARAVPATPEWRPEMSASFFKVFFWRLSTTPSCRVGVRRTSCSVAGSLHARSLNPCLRVNRGVWMCVCVCVCPCPGVCFPRGCRGSRRFAYATAGRPAGRPGRRHGIACLHSPPFLTGHCLRHSQKRKRERETKRLVG